MVGGRDHQFHPSSTPPSDLRHMTSNPALLSASSPRPPHQPIPLTPNSSRGGSRSPASIPSSPTSIHSSSSAIFERDIEALSPIFPLSHQMHHNPPNPHRTPRSKATEQLEHSVPSVLAEAASALAASSENDIAVIAPAFSLPPLSLAGSVGSRSPPLHSRSPSPSPTGQMASLPASSASSPVTARPVAIPRSSTGSSPSGAAQTPSRSPIPSPITANTPLPPLPDQILMTPMSSAHQKRLSFVSYSDLLSSTPITALPLSSLMTQQNALPPPHLQAVSAAAVSPAPSQGAPSRPLSTYSISTGLSGGGSRLAGPGEEQQGVGRRLKDDIGGEWEREGFGKGMEERLEEVMAGKA